MRYRPISELKNKTIQSNINHETVIENPYITQANKLAEEGYDCDFIIVDGMPAGIARVYPAKKEKKEPFVYKFLLRAIIPSAVLMTIGIKTGLVWLAIIPFMIYVGALAIAIKRIIPQLKNEYSEYYGELEND